MRHPDFRALLIALAAVAALFAVPLGADLAGQAVQWSSLTSAMFGLAGAVFGWAAVTLRAQWRAQR